jgi:hypothetical protein
VVQVHVVFVFVVMAVSSDIHLISPRREEERDCGAGQRPRKGKLTGTPHPIPA